VPNGEKKDSIKAVLLSRMGNFIPLQITNRGKRESGTQVQGEGSRVSSKVLSAVKESPLLELRVSHE